jgi:hypothetical protein
MGIQQSAGNRALRELIARETGTQRHGSIAAPSPQSGPRQPAV